jgi:hypothetical protein
MIRPRGAGVFTVVFAVVFAVVYLAAVWKNIALFTYHPVTGQLGAGVQRAGEGPAMYWYGWIATATLAGVASGLAACLVPERLGRRLWSGWSWLVPLCVAVAFCYLLRSYFLR